MARYILLGRVTDEGAESIATFGSEGAEQFRRYIELAKGHVVEHYVAVGNYDLVTIADFDDDRGLLIFSLAAQAGGIYIEPLRAFDIADVDEARGFIPDILAHREQVQELARMFEASEGEGGGVGPDA